MIQDENVSFEVAKLAKKKGFPQKPKENNYCDVYCWDGLRKIHSLSAYVAWFMEEYDHRNLYAAPTQSLLQRWLREEKRVVIEIPVMPTTCTNEMYEYKFYIFWNSDGHYMDAEYDDRIYTQYELALEDALKYALENLV